MTSHRRRSAPFAACLLAALGGLSASDAVAEEAASYRPLPVTTGKAVTPPPELLALVEKLKAAAEAEDPDAVYALIDREIAFATTGITIEVGRRVQTRTFPSAAAALEKIGLAFTEGEPVGPGGQTFDFRAARIATALSQIAESTADPDWGSDPLLPGAVCTRPGAKWDAKLAAKEDFQSRATFVLAAAEARSEPKADAAIVGRVAPGKLYADLSTDEEGWTKIRVPDGRAAWLAPGVGKPAQAWGFCFRAARSGEWKLSAVLSALN
jgi:hypothetical protein